MKLKYAFLLVALLSLGACSNPSTESSESDSISESEHEQTVIEKYKVKTIERTNLKIAEFKEIYAENEPVADLLVSDLSFISLKLFSFI